jgi:sugar phosphate isomerase/epimerase
MKQFFFPINRAPSSIKNALLIGCIATGICVTACAPAQQPSQTSLPTTGLFAKNNLVAWCVVPFDGKKRGPEERAEMLEKLGIKGLAYDYRDEHIPTFDAEIEALNRHGIELTAWWFPTSLNEEAKNILAVLKRHGEHPQLWVMGGGGPVNSPENQSAIVEAEAKRIGEIAVAAKAIGSMVGLYNHDNWFGEPENQIAIIERLKKDGITNLGIVYNLHHGHQHLDRFPELLEKMKPYLLALNINGMVVDGNKIDRLILPIGQGDLDLELLKTIRDSGWEGPIGILNHTDEDAELRLRDNMEGLAWAIAKLDGKPIGQKPTPSSWKKP